jgi:hypothetical protein
MYAGGYYGKGTSKDDPFILIHAGHKKTQEESILAEFGHAPPVSGVVAKAPKRKPPQRPVPAQIKDLSDTLEVTDKVLFIFHDNIIS